MGAGGPPLLIGDHLPLGLDNSMLAVYGYCDDGPVAVAVQV